MTVTQTPTRPQSAPSQGRQRAVRTSNFIDLPTYTALAPEHEADLVALADLASGSRWRPVRHLAPPCGLFNDPNGLHFDGELYHVFCQWHPFGPSHGMKHWYHFTSADLVNWDESDAMLVPDQPYEKNGCYSGNAWQDAEGTWHLYYTANYKPEANVKYPMQAVATIMPDGTLRKSDKNPIIEGAPEGVGGNIRDPFVFDYDGATYLLIGAESEPNEAGERRGVLLLYTMETPESFAFAGEVAVELPGGRAMDLGTMVECPGLVRVGSKDVLFLSLIGESADAPCQNRFATVLLTGAFDPAGLRFSVESIGNADEGFDFYAPQPFYGKGRAPMFFSWFGNGDQELPEDADGWRHAQTLPRLLVGEGGVIKTPPHPDAVAGMPRRGLKLMSGSSMRHRPLPLEHLTVAVEPTGVSELQVGTWGDFYSLRLDFEQGTATLDRSGLAIPVDVGYGMVRSCKLPQPAPGRPLELDLYADHSFHELYINGGERVFTFRAYL